MDISKWISPEKILAALGIDPRELMSEYARWNAEIAAMKKGASDAASWFGARLDKIETEQRAISATLARIECAIAMGTPANPAPFDRAGYCSQQTTKGSEP